MRRRVGLTALALLTMAARAGAQDFSAGFEGFGSGSGEPIQIEADRLEIHDPEKVAVYSGNVRARQGETLLETPEMRVFYGGGGPTDTSGAQLSRIEAGPDVLVSSPEQTASGDQMVLDMTQDLLTMTGNVVLTQGENVVRGDRLIVNLATKQGRVEGGRVQTLITPSATPSVGQ